MANAKVRPERIGRGTEPGGGRETPEAQPGVIAPLDGPVALLGEVVQVLAASVPHFSPQDPADCSAVRWQRARGRRVRCHPHRFRHTFATWAIQQDARELDVQHLLGHAGPEMVRRYTASYRAEDAARRHARFSPADQMLRGIRVRRTRALLAPHPACVGPEASLQFPLWEPAQSAGPRSAHRLQMLPKQRAHGACGQRMAFLSGEADRTE